MIITIEGSDASGKDTVAARLAVLLGARTMNFPCDDTATGPMIRRYLAREWAVVNRGEDDQEVDQESGALAFQALQIMNRMEKMDTLALYKDSAQILILVRYWQSGWVYGGLDGLPEPMLRKCHEHMVHADYNILLDVSPGEAVTRQHARQAEAGIALERYEGKLETTRKIRDRYLYLWDQGGAGQWDTVLTDDKTIDAVAAEVLALLVTGRFLG